MGYLFDSVQLYVETLREAVVSGLDPFNGSLIAKMLRRSEFEGISSEP